MFGHGGQVFIADLLIADRGLGEGRKAQGQGGGRRESDG